MMWGGYAAWSWFWMGLTALVVWGAFVALLVWVVRSVTGRGEGGRDPALQTLRRRLAAGEISEEEFEKTRRVLQA